MIALLLVFVAAALGAPIDVNFCNYLDVEYSDLDSDGGDRWTSDADKPARGAYYELFEWVGMTKTFQFSGELIAGGTDAGCTGDRQLQSLDGTTWR